MGALPSSPGSRGTGVFAVTIAMICLSTIFTALRMVSRIGYVKRVKVDDYFIMVAWLLAFAMSFTICFGTHKGLGMHETDIPENLRAALKKSEYAISVIYNPALMATKTSILAFYLTLSHGNKIFRYLAYGTLAVVNLAGISLTFLNMFQCRPVDAAFRSPIPEDARCQDIVTLFLSSAPVNIITDLAILFLPMPLLTSMSLPTKQKIILVITFGFGFFVAVVDVIRIAYLQEASLKRLQDINNMQDTSGTHQRNTTDVSWYASLSYMWSAVEVNVGIMCANVPGLKPLVARFMPHIIRDNLTAHLSSSTEKRMSQRKSRSGHSSDSPVLAPTHPTEPAEITDAVDPLTHPSDVHRRASVDPAEMDMEFLTNPDMAELPPDLRSPLTKATTYGTHSSEPARFYDFVTMNNKKSLVKLSNRQSLFPIFMVTILFFLWGVAYGFLDTLNSKFQDVANMSQGKTVGIHSAYYGAYSVAVLTFGRLIFIHFGFKACFITGLVIYGCGTLVFWPSAVLTSFPAFLVSNIIVGTGLSLLEIASNPFVALCGPPQWMELRLNLSQGVQAVGTVVAPLLANKVLFKSASDPSSLVDVQWTYLGIALFVVVLAVVFYYVPLPEATDEELEEASQHPDLINLYEVHGVRLVLITLIMACIAQFCYVGAQEAVSTTFPQYIREQFASYGRLMAIDADDYLAIGHSTFAAGRFFFAFLNLWIKPRILLLIAFTGALVCSILTMALQDSATEAVILVLYFFEGPLFSFIYAIALRGLGRFTKDGASLITAAISGGAVFPPIVYGIAGGTSGGYRTGYAMVVTGFAIGMIFPLYLNLVPAARQMADPVDEKRHRQLQRRRDAENGNSRRQTSDDTTSPLRKDGGSSMVSPPISPPPPPEVSWRQWAD